MSFIDERQQLIEALGYFWTKIFLDSEFIEGYVDSFSLRLTDLRELSDNLPDYASRKLLPVTEIRENRIFVFDESTLDTDAFKYGDGGVYGGGATYGQQRTSFDEYIYPFPVNFEPEFLAPIVVEPDPILRRGEDYEIENGFIKFKTNPLELDNLIKKTVPDSTGAPVFLFYLWGFKVEEDIKAVCDFFGTVAGVCGDSTELVKEAVNIAWDLRVDGATVDNTHRLLSIITNTDYVETPGTVQEIYYEGDRICIRTDNAIYTAPADNLATVTVGESIEKSQIIFDTFSIKYGADKIDFDDFEGLTLGPGYLTKDITGELLFINEQVSISKVRHPDWYDVVEE